VNKRPQCGDREMVRAVGPATERVTTCHGDHGRHGAGHVQHRVTLSRPQVTAVTAPVTAFTAPVTATTVTEGGQWVRIPRRRRPPPGQLLSPGRAEGQKAVHLVGRCSKPPVAEARVGIGPERT
jgi:hypothetical protein